MSRSNTQKRSKSSKRKATKKRFGMESMEARRLMAGDVAVAIDPVAIESVRPIAVVEDAGTTTAQTREHILPSRQVDVPSVADAGANPMDLKRGIDDTAAAPGEAFIASNGTTVGTADEVQAPQSEAARSSGFVAEDNLYDPGRDKTVDPP